MAPGNGPTGTQGPPRSGNKPQMTFRNSTWFPEGRSSGHERLPTSLRGTSTKNGDHNDPRAPHNDPRTSTKNGDHNDPREHNNDPRAPQDIQGTLRKSRSQVPRPPRANGPRPRATSQRSPAGHKGHRNECQDAQRAIEDRRALNSTPNVQTGQNRLSRRRVARAFVHTTHGDIRLIQILVIQAFQIFKLIGRRRSDASSIKSQAFSGFSLNRMGPTAQPRRAIKPQLNPKPRLIPLGQLQLNPKPRLIPLAGSSKEASSFPPPQIQIPSYTHSHPSPPIIQPLASPTLNMTFSPS
ncbi:hypothetical protein CDL15_Pgr021934 [Punica granatum]|uniref:Uncharacterized protein n=1 Tax=Punica granatum TaxID=22663 RepID=A0A218XGL0_PUNGR|nr:hypothetical protein CDL15_Pgr021934 [Punica granatum]